MFDFRKIALWLVVLLVPGGILLLPLLLANMYKRRAAKANTEASTETPSHDQLPPLAA